MSLNSNRWQRRRYTLWAPVYDRLVRVFQSRRQRSMDLLNLQAGERVLLVGAGTGLDLEFLPRGLHLTAIDLTPAMIARLRRRSQRLGLEVDARVMDGHALAWSDGSFDAVILHLILAVIPDPVQCLREVERVLRAGGRAVILDKFIPDNQNPPWFLRLLNPLSRMLGTELTRQLGPIRSLTRLQQVHEEASGLGGYFKTVVLRKP